MEWFAHLAPVHKAAGVLVLTLLVGITLGQGINNVTGVPKQVRINTEAIVRADSSAAEWRDEVSYRLDRIENALVFHMCEANHTTLGQAFTDCVVTMRRQIREMSNGNGNRYR